MRAIIALTAAIIASAWPRSELVEPRDRVLIEHAREQGADDIHECDAKSVNTKPIEPVLAQATLTWCVRWATSNCRA